MSQQVQELIDKIKSEGVQEAQQQAQEIEKKAQQQSSTIINDAKNQAEKLIIEAKEEVKKLQESTHMALKQSSRDTLLSLRKQIDQTLQKIIQTQVSDSLSADTLSSIIADVIKKFIETKDEKIDIHLAVSAKEIEKLKGGAIAKLQKQIKSPFKMESSSNIGKGFIISFDGGKSCFDFTDESLAEYLGAFLNSQISALVLEASTQTVPA